jgi:microcompartment protein CcmL/EutN
MEEGLLAALEAIGLVELTSIGVGIHVEDAMLKAASVELLVARTICSGKYIIVIGGEVSAVRASVAAGVELAEDALVEERVIPRVHPAVFPAIGLSIVVPESPVEALGVVETFSAASIIEAADAAAKAASVTVFRVHLAMAIGGKGFLLMTGDVAAVEAAVEAGAAVAAADGILVSKAVIRAPRRELLEEFI